MKLQVIAMGAIALCCTAAEAKKVKCCAPANCCPTPVCSSPCQSSCSNGPTTKLWKGKDGVIRETITHWEALHRSVEADKLEEDLATVRGELDSTKSELAALQEKAAADKAQFEQQIAALKAQLDGQTKLAAEQTQRAEKSEAAHKQTSVQLADVQKNLQQTASERDALKAANDKLQAEVKELVAARKTADESLKAAQAEIASMKQAAIESKKAEVASNDDEKNPAEGEEPAPEPAQE